VFRLIDWMMRLPDALEREFLDEHYAFEEAQHMPYVTSAERFGIEKGRQEALKEAEDRIKEARLEAKRETVRNLIETTNLDNVTIANATGLSEDEVHELRSTH
jgi:predicted transposase/invertase (TIGR01784 family)